MTKHEKRQHQASLKFISKARDFFKRIGLPFEIVPSYQPDPSDTFFKGCWLNNGKLYFCPARVQVGELLHEAGHLALVPKSQWKDLTPGELTTEIPLGYFSPIGDAAVEAWDYAAALAADIPELAVFQSGFNGAGFTVWEAFDDRQHCGFALLRFLDMSREWGKCHRWFIGDAVVEDGEEGARKVFRTCAPTEARAILAASIARLKSC